MVVGLLLCFCSVVHQNVTGLLGGMQGVQCLDHVIPLHNLKCKEVGDFWLFIICKGTYTTVVHAVVYNVA